MESQLRSEIQRQREHMEANVELYKPKAIKKQDSADDLLVQQNLALLKTISELEIKLKKSDNRNKSMERLLGPALMNLSPKEAKARLDRALKVNGWG